MSAATVQLALDVLDDPRLADARTHLVEAQQRLQEHDPDEAVDEARMAVEYGARGRWVLSSAISTAPGCRPESDSQAQRAERRGNHSERRCRRGYPNAVSRGTASWSFVV
jgi:hypothetical protein